MVTLPGADAPDACTPAQSATETVEEEKKRRRRSGGEVRPRLCGRSQSEQGRVVGGRVNHQALPFFSYRQERHYDLKGEGVGGGA